MERAKDLLAKNFLIHDVSVYFNQSDELQIAAIWLNVPPNPTYIVRTPATLNLLESIVYRQLMSPF